MKKLTQEEAKQKTKDIGGILIGEYIDSYTKTKFECLECNQIFIRIPNNIWRQKQILCRKCSLKQAGERRRHTSKEKSLGFLYPEIAKLYSKNNELSIFEIYPGSSIKRKWICEKYGYNHEYKTTPAQIIYGKTRCPHCSGQKVLVGFNDLASQRPDLLLEWDYKENKVLPTEVTCGSNYKASWRCNKNQHKWKAKIKDRSHGSGCPYCSGHKILIDFNDLASQYPEIAREWHPTKNGNLQPTQIISGSNKKRWWICLKYKHEWQTSPNHRVYRKHGCPYCSGHQVLKGFNDLQTLYPEITKEWHPTKNGKLKPTQVTSKSHKKVWWLCSKCQYEWKTRIADRTSGRGCPNCCPKSYGEEKILTKQNIDFIPQKIFPNLRGLGNGLLKYDFYLPNYNLLIEFHGKQHYKYDKNWDQGLENFKQQQKHDQIKKEWAEKNNISLFIIPYWQQKDIESILLKELQLC